jgi:serine phosphatase RsbU (regulator of sigma subunit)
MGDVRALWRGADDYLRKPFEAAELRAVLDRAVERLELSRQNAALRRQLDDERRRLEAELAQAARVQAELLARTPPRLAGFELAARCLPAREVGGDFYDWQQPARDRVTRTARRSFGRSAGST